MSENPVDAPWLAIIGIGEDGIAALAPAARALLDAAEIVAGGDRHLAMLPDDGRERLAWPSPLADGIDRLMALSGRRIALLATGDPMHFGIGATLAARVPAAERIVVPAPSAFALAAARLGWPLQATETISLHGRPIETLALHVAPGSRILALAEDRKTPSSVAAWLSGHGFGESRIVALAHMGGEAETRVDGLADTWSVSVPDFHTLAIECVAGAGALWYPRTAGLPDDAFRHDGKLTKREARALALAKLMPHPGALLWDVGAGSGAIGIEWLRAAPGARAIALEPRAERRAMAAENAIRLGVPALDVRDATAPEGFAGLPAPDAIFLGGGISETAIRAAQAALKPGGRLVAHAVTLETEALLLAAHETQGGELVRIAIARAEPVGPYHGWRPAMPVTQWSWRKR